MSASPRRVLATVTAAQVLSVAAATTVGVSLPDLAADLGASGSEQQWVVDAYVLVFASLLIAGGVLGDRRGRRDALLAGLALFAVGSLVCALAPSVSVLLGGRVLQGLGPPLVLPATLAIITTTFAVGAERSRAIGLWGAGSGLAIAGGPLLGGALIEAGSWRLVFAANVPVAASIAVDAARTIRRDRRRPSAHPFDAVAAAQVTGGTALMVFAVIEGRALGWASPAILGCLAAAVILLVALVRRERRHPAPLVRLELLRHRPFVAANLGGAVLFGVLTGLSVYLAVFFQQVQGRSALQAGLCLAPLGALIAVCAPVAGRMTGRFGPRAPMLLGLAFAAVAVLALMRLQPTTSVAESWWALALLGAGTGLALPSMTITALASVPAAEAGLGSAMHNTARQVGQTFGVAVFGTVILSRAGETAARTRLVGPAATAWVDGLHVALGVAVALLALAALAVAVLIPRASTRGAPAAAVASR